MKQNRASNAVITYFIHFIIQYLSNKKVVNNSAAICTKIVVTIMRIGPQIKQFTLRLMTDFFAIILENDYSSTYPFSRLIL